MPHRRESFYTYTARAGMQRYHELPFCFSFIVVSIGAGVDLHIRSARDIDRKHVGVESLACSLRAILG